MTGELDGLSRTKGYGEVTRQGTFSLNVTRGRMRVRLTRKGTDLIVLNNRRHVRWRLAALRWLRSRNTLIYLYLVGLAVVANRRVTVIFKRLRLGLA